MDQISNTKEKEKMTSEIIATKRIKLLGELIEVRLIRVTKEESRYRSACDYVIPRAIFALRKDNENLQNAIQTRLKQKNKE